MNNKWFERRNNCPACLSDKFIEIYENRFDEDPIRRYLENFYTPQGRVEFACLADASYILCECSNCRLIFQREIPNKYLLERLYEHWIDPKIAFDQHKRKDLEYYSSFAKEIMLVITLLDKIPSTLKVFDYGMGWGSWAQMAKAFGCDTYGAELSTDRIEHAKKNGIHIISWTEIPRNKFDFINTEQVFEHIPEPLATLRHLKSALKDGGLFKISVPNTKNIDKRLARMDWNAKAGSKFNLNAVAPLEHINCYKEYTLEKMAAEAGMRVVTIPKKLQNRYLANWKKPKRIVKNIAQITFGKSLKKSSYVFLRKNM